MKKRMNKVDKATDSQDFIKNVTNNAEKKIETSLNKASKILAIIVAVICIFAVCASLYVDNFEKTSPAMGGIVLHDINPKAANITPLIRYQEGNKSYSIVNYSGKDGLHSAIIRIEDRKIVKDERLDMSADGDNPMILAQLLHDLYPNSKSIKLTSIKTSTSIITINHKSYRVNTKATNLNSYVEQANKQQHMVKHNPNYLLLGDGTQRTLKKEHVDAKAIQVTLVQFDHANKKNVITFLDYNSGKSYRLTLDLHNNVSLYNLG